MSPIKDSRNGKHFTEQERLMIERLYKKKIPVQEIALIMDRHKRTIERELKRGRVTHLDSELREYETYSSERAQADYDFNSTAKGPELKLGNDYEFIEHVRKKIIDQHWSPDAIIGELNQKGNPFSCRISTKTLYNYIDQGFITGVTLKDLPNKGKKPKRKKRSVSAVHSKNPFRKGIEMRPPEVEKRVRIGDWEIDLIRSGTGKGKTVLLTLCERKSRLAILRKLKDGTQEEVSRAFRRLERELGTRKFRKIFKTITSDNGPEFLNDTALEKSAFSRKKRTLLFYAHPYSAWERGSNENMNRIIRRFIPKGSDLALFSHEEIRVIEKWLNEYPRKIFNYLSAKEVFDETA